MNLATVKRGLRQLPYLEMESLAGEVRTALSTAIDSPQVATALATLRVEPDENLEQDQTVLAEFFTRKRNITITPAYGSDIGYDISMTGGPSLRCTNIREGMGEFLETLVAYKALEK